MNKKLVIIGASGHGKVVADIALKLKKYEEIVFLDDKEEVNECMNFPVVGKSSDAKQYLEKADFFVAIGNGKTRKRLTEQLQQMQANIINLIHPMAAIGENVIIGNGTVIMAGAVVNPDSKIGQGCIINTCASVDHDCNIGDYVHVSVGAHLCGTVQIEEMTWVGAGAVVVNNVSIRGCCVIGAGATVLKPIDDMGTYVGTPARKV